MFHLEPIELSNVETRASLPLDAVKRPRDMPIWKLEAVLKQSILPEATVSVAGPLRNATLPDVSAQPISN